MHLIMKVSKPVRQITSCPEKCFGFRTSLGLPKLCRSCGYPGWYTIIQQTDITHIYTVLYSVQ